jgi:GNAT superfamily N-acetyltransferase
MSLLSVSVVGDTIRPEVPYRKVTMRSVRGDDGGRLFAVAKLAFAEGDDSRTLAALARDTVFVAELAGEPAGYVAIEESAAALRIEQLCVHPAHEQEGVGKQLLEWAEGYAISSGAERLEVVVERGNERAESFYRGRGFVPVAPDLLELVLPQSR